MMIANFGEHIAVPTAKTGLWTVRTQYYEVPRGTLVERVCNFLERYPLPPAGGRDISLSASGERPRSVVRG